MSKQNKATCTQNNVYNNNRSPLFAYFRVSETTRKLALARVAMVAMKQYLVVCLREINSEVW
jgi:hypothetical protein